MSDLQLYLLIGPPGACIIACLLMWWATKRSAKRLESKIGRDQ